MYLSPRKKLWVETASEMFGGGSVISKAESIEVSEKLGIPKPTWFWKACKSGYNQFELPNGSEYGAPAPIVSTPEASGAVSTVNLVATNMEKQNLVPAPFEGFVPWGNFALIEKVVKSGLFYPIFVTGLSGNGKTLMIEQVCAKLKKELIRVNLSLIHI